MAKWTGRRWGMAAPSARVHIISIDVPTSRRSRTYWMLFKRSADIIIKGHHRKTGRPCGLGSCGLRRRTASEEETGREEEKAVFKVDSRGPRASATVHCALCKTANTFLLRRNFDGRGGARKIKKKKERKRTVNMTAIMRSSDTQTHPWLILESVSSIGALFSHTPPPLRCTEKEHRNVY